MQIDISVLFITYNRSDLLELTFNAVRERIDFENLRVEFIVSDDASDEPHRSRVLAIPFDKHLIADENQGIGSNCNKGLAAANGRYILQIQDDCEFIGDKKLIFTVLQILESDPQIGSVQLNLLTPDVPHEIRRLRDGTRYRIFENDRIRRLRDTGARPYSDQPHLKRKQFHEDIGPYKERTPMADMELNYQRRVACQQRWRIAALEGRSSFKHLGASRSFNPAHERAKRLTRLYAYPLIGPIFRLLRPAARRVRGWVRQFRL